MYMTSFIGDISIDNKLGLSFFFFILIYLHVADIHDIVSIVFVVIFVKACIHHDGRRICVFFTTLIVVAKLL